MTFSVEFSEKHTGYSKCLILSTRPRLASTSQSASSRSTIDHFSETPTRRQNGESEPLRSCRPSACPPADGLSPACADHTTSPHAPIRKLLRRPHSARLNGLARLTAHQVLAVDLLNPSPAAYAHPPRSRTSTLD